VAKPRLRRYLPRPAHSEQLTEALRYADPKFRCWLVLAAYQGLRVQEIAGLERADVEEGLGLLRVVHGKGDKARMLFLHPEVLAALRALPMPKSGRIFRRPLGGVYTPAVLSQSFNRALKDHGVEATAHQLRHWFATNLLRATHDLRVVQEAMGHSSPSTTAIYTAFDDQAMADGIAALTLDGSA
jgi:integrase